MTFDLLPDQKKKMSKNTVPKLYSQKSLLALFFFLFCFLCSLVFFSFWLWISIVSFLGAFFSHLCFKFWILARYFSCPVQQLFPSSRWDSKSWKNSQNSNSIQHQRFLTYSSKLKLRIIYWLKLKQNSDKKSFEWSFSANQSKKRIEFERVRIEQSKSAKKELVSVFFILTDGSAMGWH